MQDELLKELNLVEVEFDRDLEKHVFSQLLKVEGLQEYLKLTLALDVKRHFSVKKEQQDLVHGGYARTKYFLERLKREGNAELNLTTKK